MGSGKYTWHIKQCYLRTESHVTWQLCSLSYNMKVNLQPRLQKSCFYNNHLTQNEIKYIKEKGDKAPGFNLSKNIRKTTTTDELRPLCIQKMYWQTFFLYQSQDLSLQSKILFRSPCSNVIKKEWHNIKAIILNLFFLPISYTSPLTV